MDWVDLSTWERKQHFEHFSQMQLPHYNICANVDVTQTLNYCRINELSSFNVIAYAITRAANSLENFRLRIRDEKVCKHPSIHPSITFIKDKDIFGYFVASYHKDFRTFNQNVESEIEQSTKRSELSANITRDDLIYLSCLPWIQFTSISHAMNVPATDSIPRFSWGKYFKEGVSTMMPLSVHVHHALVDGIHVGQFFEQVQEILSTPTSYK